MKDNTQYLIMEVNTNTPVNSFYTIVTGLFRFEQKKLDEEGLWKNFTNWRDRINGGDYEGAFNYLNHSYYDSYLNNIFPEIRFDESQLQKFHPRILNHITLKSCLSDKEHLKNLTLKINKNQSIKFDIEYIDLYLFPFEIGVFSFKTIIKEEKITLGLISDFLNKIRHLDTLISLENKGKYISLKDFLKNQILADLFLEDNWTVYNPQLKLYSQIDLKDNIPEKEMDYLLYDMGNVSVIGSAKGVGIFAPSESYLKEQLANNKISVFKNWSALALYDTFTRISTDFPDTFKSWEYDYFNLYIHCIYIKFFMYLTNSELSYVTIVDKQTEKIRNRFIEFINDYHHSHISYKFLPDLLQDKMLYSLEIQSEIEKMETKIQRINEQFQEKREKSFNIALIVITLLSVFSVIYDLSEWTVRMGVEREFIYPVPSITSGIIIFLLIYLIFKVKSK
ncbi:MAG: hypothetical protein KAX05_09105 [Bacteroidales bacterium]|nr:hypothetical protein [Bacteroidales bacterium]